jgi:hypothetical protein
LLFYDGQGRTLTRRTYLHVDRIKNYPDQHAQNQKASGHEKVFHLEKNLRKFPSSLFQAWDSAQPDFNSASVQAQKAAGRLKKTQPTAIFTTRVFDDRHLEIF